MGNKICPAAPGISHIFFADDSLLFCRATVEEGQAVRSILDENERLWASRQLQQIRHFFSKNVHDERRVVLKNLMGI